MSNSRSLITLARPQQLGTTLRSADYTGRIDTGGGISSKLVRWRADNQERATQALARRATAEAAVYDAQTKVIDSYIARERAIARLQELPEILATDAYRRQADRDEERLEVLHQRQLASERRGEELADARRKRLQAENYEQYVSHTGRSNLLLGSARKRKELSDMSVDIAVSGAELAQMGSADAKPEDLTATLENRERALRADGDHEGALRVRNAIEAIKGDR